MKDNNDEKVLLNVHDMAKYLGIGEKTCRKLLRDDNGFTIKIGCRYFAVRDKLNKWIEEKT